MYRVMRQDGNEIAESEEKYKPGDMTKMTSHEGQQSPSVAHSGRETSPKYNLQPVGLVIMVLILIIFAIRQNRALGSRLYYIIDVVVIIALGYGFGSWHTMPEELGFALFGLLWWILKAQMLQRENA